MAEYGACCVGCQVQVSPLHSKSSGSGAFLWGHSAYRALWPPGGSGLAGDVVRGCVGDRGSGAWVRGKVHAGSGLKRPAAVLCGWRYPGTQAVPFQRRISVWYVAADVPQ
jgi:hypothetical protein